MSPAIESATRLMPAALHDAAMTVHCPYCQVPPGTACHASPAGQHIARYSRAYKDRQLTPREATAVFDAAPVIANWALVTITDLADSADTAASAGTA